jgi:hypothetical protein
MSDIVERLSDVGLWGEAKAEIKRLRAERDALQQLAEKYWPKQHVQAIMNNAAIDAARKAR